MGKENKHIAVIGAGFSGIAAASYLAKKGYKVTILEKNDSVGGRARKFETDGFIFDMGPSWYWMPDVFENYFASFGKKVADYYELIRLDPSYSVYFGKDHKMAVPAQMEALYAMFENYETGSSNKLKRFLKEAKYKYDIGMNEFVQKPGHSIMEFADLRVLKSLFKLQMFTSMDKYLKQLFKNPYLIQLLEFPVLFLGATPENTPALYSLMNYADISLGTWYPKGGMHKIIEGMIALATELGVNIETNQEVQSFVFNGKTVTEVISKNGRFQVDAVVSSADYEHTEQKLLPKQYRKYSTQYWDKRVMAPSSLLFYLGINKRLKGLDHHNLFFDEDFNQHAYEIYEDPKWPSKPLFYVSVPSLSDSTIAPAGHENVFLLVPVAPGLNDDEAIRENYFNIVMDRLESITGQEIRSHIVYKRSFAHKDFVKDYHAFKGNAYGLANTLFQTAFLKPKMKNPKIDNFLFTGQLTTPGPGVPPSIISGQVVATEMDKLLS